MAKILVIEDAAALCRLYESILGQRGHEVISVHDGSEALSAAMEHQPDLIVLDLFLPGMSGEQVVDSLREAKILPAVPLILTTAIGKGDAQVIAHSLRADRLVTKPFDIAELIQAVDGALAARGAEAGEESGSPQS